MEFMMTGFRQKDGIRRLRFTGTLAGRSREFSVDTDTALLRRYGIALQELPLLCRRLLEKDALRQDVDVLTFSEDLMREHAERRAATQRVAEERRKNHRRPHPSRERAVLEKSDVSDPILRPFAPEDC